MGQLPFPGPHLPAETRLYSHGLADHAVIRTSADSVDGRGPVTGVICIHLFKCFQLLTAQIRGKPNLEDPIRVRFVATLRSSEKKHTA